MKTNIFIFVMLIMTANAFAGIPIETIKKVSVTQTPYLDGKGAIRYINYFVRSEQLSPIHPVMYDDFGCKTEFTPSMQNGAMLVRRLEITHGNYPYLVALDCQESDYCHTYLATLDSYGNVIDYLSAGIDFAMDNIIAVKQWELLTDMTVVVYQLKIDTPSLRTYPRFERVRAQRIDIYYKITDSGKFQKQREVSYLSKDYTYAELDNMKNIKEGDEKR